MSHRKRIQQLFLSHAEALQGFFRKRLWQVRDARDLTQEVYLRLLRAGENQPIHNPEAYLYTVANNLVKERRVMQRRDAQQVALTHPVVDEVLKAQALMNEPDLVAGVDLTLQRRCLQTLLPELPARTRLVLMLAFEEELSHQQIADRLGISKTMVHKILAQAIAHCRKRMADLEELWVR
jgi:RNA polymerase sigma factor (sigma-70 family)